MLELPNFSESMKKFYRDYLEWAKKYFKLSIEVSKNECILYEFDFTLVDALRELGETNFLISEYRSRTTSYKYAKYKELDMQRRI